MGLGIDDAELQTRRYEAALLELVFKAVQEFGAYRALTELAAAPPLIVEPPPSHIGQAPLAEQPPSDLRANISRTVALIEGGHVSL